MDRTKQAKENFCRKTRVQIAKNAKNAKNVRERTNQGTNQIIIITPNFDQRQLKIN
jgi:hypothetical protein